MTTLLTALMWMNVGFAALNLIMGIVLHDAYNLAVGIGNILAAYLCSRGLSHESS